MEKVKKHSVVIIVILALLVIISFAVHSSYKKNYSLADFGVPPLLKPDCSSVKNTNTNSPVTISLNAPNVSAMRDKIKLLIIKYNGQVTSDSFNSYPIVASAPSGYPSPTINASSQDTANITATFDKSQNDFLTDLSGVVVSSGGVNTGYSYTDASQPQNGNIYSSYTSCINMIQSIQADILQLEIFTKALKEDNNLGDVSLLSQSVSTAKSNLQNDVNNINNFFATSDEPSVSISINTLQK